MSNEPKPNKSELIPSINRSLAIKRSGLVKRGLELLQEKKQQQARVLIGNCDDNINDILAEIIKNKYGSKIRLSFFGEEILELAEAGAIDIFILIMNNHSCPN